MDRPDSALAEVVSPPAPDPAEVAAHVRQAGILRTEKRFAEAEAAARAAIAADSQSAAAHHAAAWVFWSERLLEAADGEFRAMLACPPTADTERFCTDYVRLLLEQNRLEAALRLADRTVELAPDLAVAHVVRGAVLAAQDEDADAMAAYRKALQLDPHNVQALNKLGCLELKAGHPAQAAILLRQALRLSPDDELMQADLARALRAGVPLYGWLSRWGSYNQRRLIVAFVVAVWLAVVLPGLLAALAGPNTPASAAIQNAWPVIVAGLILLGLLTPAVWALLPPLINTVLGRDPLARQVLGYDPMDPVRTGLLLALLGSVAATGLTAALLGLGSGAFGAASGCILVSILALVLVPGSGSVPPTALRRLRAGYGVLVVSAYLYMLLLPLAWDLGQSLAGVAFVAGLALYGLARVGARRPAGAERARSSKKRRVYTWRDCLVVTMLVWVLTTLLLTGLTLMFTLGRDGNAFSLLVPTGISVMPIATVLALIVFAVTGLLAYLQNQDYS